MLTFEIVTLNWENIGYSINLIPNESGVYQIYGDSPLYGQNTLLYIGSAENLHERIANQHMRWRDISFITKQPNITFRIAKIDQSIIRIVEEILIVMHKPSFNSSSVINISPKSREHYIYIQNHGERGMLNLEVTNYYFINNIPA